jgi:hypothetical protein
MFAQEQLGGGLGVKGGARQRHQGKKCSHREVRIKRLIYTDAHAFGDCGGDMHAAGIVDAAKSSSAPKGRAKLACAGRSAGAAGKSACATSWPATTRVLVNGQSWWLVVLIYATDTLDPLES